ncbi:MAG: PilZ domain-containing protein [Desulfobacterales bacterium]|nr:PilZ domain-containing protein [Desulfobacterales bacterium]
MKKTKYDGPERRQYFRYNLIYAPKDKATLKIGTHSYEVLDMSKEGLRFKNDGEPIMDKKVSGVLEFSDGDTRMVEAEIIWEQENEVGLKFTPQSQNA